MDTDKSKNASSEEEHDQKWWIAHLRGEYDKDPESVDPAWREYFAAVDLLEEKNSIQLEDQQQSQSPVNTVSVAAESGFEDHAGDHQQSKTAGNTEVVTRSDLPPAPPSQVNEATSPYTRTHPSYTAADLNEEAATEDTYSPLKGIAKATAKNMDASLNVPTATTQRQIPAKILIENRILVNSHLARSRGGKISFTHLIAYAIIEALCEMPNMNVRYLVDEKGRPTIEHMAHIGFGLAIDVAKPDGSRSLMVPVLQDADTLTFVEFVAAYEDTVKRAREGKLDASDFQGITVSLTNPGTLGTTTSVPRLMEGQGLIVGVGATDYPAEYAGVSPRKLALMGIGKTMYMSSTYDHRVIQGAASGDFLRLISQKLAGKNGFYDRVFQDLHIPYPPYQWESDHEYEIERELDKSARISELIQAYRSRGHLAADTDPFAYKVRRHPDLDITSYGLSVWDLDRSFATGGLGGSDKMNLRDILQRLRDTYSHTIGIEYMHIPDPTQRQWVQNYIEQPYSPPSSQEQKHILSTLNHAEAFEEFLQTKYVGQKRFSLEGGESLIPLLDTLLTSAAKDGLPEVTIGMAHRGRLNVLANIAGKSYGQIFSEFEGNSPLRDQDGTGDVKYHLGTEGVFSVEDGVATKVYIAANPSHLEAGDGVLEGITRAKQDVLSDPTQPIIPVLIHGDAAFIGQGVVQETLNMSQLKGYRTGGTIHIVVNNQIGFTTGPTSGRSTRYPTDLARGLQIPVMHVNGDDPEAVVYCANLAMKYRKEFRKDVIIDLVCYRRRGHNEGDDPSMTQPVMYDLIRRIPSTRAVYTRNLIGRGQLTQEEAQDSLKEYEDELNKILTETREKGWQIPQSQLPGQGMMIGWESAVPQATLERVGASHMAFPPSFTPHPKIKQLCERRYEMSTGSRPIDWGFGELLALGSLVMEGTPVRVSGQDARRATFVQRHAVLHDHADGREFTPLQFLTPNQADFEIYDSPLSEYAVLGFEYGYSVERPDALVIWEAQFGDFANGAQTIIDEFISSAEQKWGQRSSVVLLLPHGFEGQGPDHSSARIERYLTLAAQDNMWICQPSTPANHFHMLRTQAYRRPRTPLIVFTPKQLLRLSAATSTLDEFTHGVFQPVIGEAHPMVVEHSDGVTQVIMCSGRLYYDLLKYRDSHELWNSAIIRIEQYYPLPLEELRTQLDTYPQASLVWAQDEPRNQGAWPFLALNLFSKLDKPVRGVTRAASASPAAGRSSTHNQEREALLVEAFNH